jgi:Protein of unknown function (DUF2635)
MQGRIYLKPATDDGVPRNIRKPVGGHLAHEGEWVNPESYWTRRITDGDVYETEDSQAAVAAKAVAASKPAGKPANPV